MKWIQMGSLKAIEVLKQFETSENKTEEEKKTKKKDALLTVILLHGFGANPEDLLPIGLSSSLKGVRWLFPEAPFSIPFQKQARSWIPFEEEDLQRFYQRIDNRTLRHYVPKDLQERCDPILSGIDKMGLLPSRLILGGFSQGSMLATEILSRMQQKAKALVVLSGALVNEEDLKIRLPSCKGIPFFQSHGREDKTLPYDLALELEKDFYKVWHEGQTQRFFWKS